MTGPRLRLQAQLVADEPARRLIADALGTTVPPLIYVGQAGGGSSAASLWSRIAGNHIGGTVRSSTFRWTITAVLAGTGRSPADPDVRLRPSDVAVSAWIKEHLSIAVVAVPDRATVLALEEAALRFYDPPLNLQGMPGTAARRRLSVLRSGVGPGGLSALGRFPGRPGPLGG